ncbi:HNH endonuclease [Mesorhizobium yinganensis]|uniref:HNH endonuclease n=1 Tax=Mesorhizobium yinganensis TaxID=3157707 RepID=UPI0032B78430
MKVLPSQETLRALLDYDPMTGELTWKFRPLSMFASQRAFSTWNNRYAGMPAFTAIDKKGYRVGAIQNVFYRASRVIYKREHNVDADQVDHEDGDTLNNRLLNLRDVTGQQNQMNMKTPSNNTSGHIGVVWDKAKQKWAARIKHERRHINLGRFNDFDAAVAARKEAEIKYGFHQNHGR